MSSEESGLKIADDRSGTSRADKRFTPMLSLENTFRLNNILGFRAHIRKLWGAENVVAYVVEPQNERLAANLISEHSQAKYVLRRGNSIEGIDVTDDVKTIEKCRIQIENILEHIEFHAEA